jgi:hypothetical protein
MDATHPVDVVYPDTLLVGGKIVTVDPTAAVAEALATLNGRISAIGSSSEIRRLAGLFARLARHRSLRAWARGRRSLQIKPRVHKPQGIEY